jgi:hypothetical protein
MLHRQVQPSIIVPAKRTCTSRGYGASSFNCSGSVSVLCYQAALDFLSNAENLALGLIQELIQV